MTNETKRTNPGGRRSKLRQMLSWATGDRAAEGEALADRSGPAVNAEDATTAVRRAHGDLGVPATEERAPESDADRQDFARPKDARAERDAED